MAWPEQAPGAHNGGNRSEAGDAAAHVARVGRFGRPTLVALDGVEGSGVTTFASLLVGQVVLRLGVGLPPSTRLVDEVGGLVDVCSDSTRFGPSSAHLLQYAWKVLPAGQLRDERSERVRNVGAEGEVGDASLLASPAQLVGGR